MADLEMKVARHLAQVVAWYGNEDNAAFVRRLIDLLGNHAICVPRVGKYHHPLAAVYRLEVADAVDKLLAEDRLRPLFLFEAMPTRVVEAAELADVDPTFQTLRNLNTPEEYAAALRELHDPLGSD